jgi:hypothetical protein
MGAATLPTFHQIGSMNRCGAQSSTHPPRHAAMVSTKASLAKSMIAGAPSIREMPAVKVNGILPRERRVNAPTIAVIPLHGKIQKTLTLTSFRRRRNAVRGIKVAKFAKCVMHVTFTLMLFHIWR